MSDRYRLIEADFSSEFMSLINQAARDNWRVVVLSWSDEPTGKFMAMLERQSSGADASRDDVRFMDVPPPGLA